jgi:type II secretory pathway pseudopilin PulG
MNRPGHSRTRAGFTLVEIMVSTVIFMSVAWALKDTVLMADRSREAVFDRATSNGNMRDASRDLAREFKAAQASTMTVTAGAYGNSDVTVQHPIKVGTLDTWGIEDPRIAGGAPQAGWSVRITVQDITLGGEVVRRLLRQVLDDGGLLKRQEVLLAGLSLDPATPGFTVIQTGDVWAVTLALQEQGETDRDGRKLDFHFRTRN